MIPRFHLADTCDNTSEDKEARLTDWQRFEDLLLSLNRENEDVVFKLLLLSRHGEGWHNVAESVVGTQAWDV